MSTSMIRQSRKNVKRRRLVRRSQRGASAWPSWVDDHTWEVTPEFLAPLAEELPARERELDVWGDVIADNNAWFGPSVAEELWAAEHLNRDHEDRTADSLHVIGQLRSEANLGMIASVVAHALANDQIDLY